MKITPSKLRENVYRILDQVLESGTPVEVVRKGRVVKLVPEKAPSKLDRLIRRPEFLNCDPEAIVHVDWSERWKP